MSLTAKQERFVAEYLVDLNATQAAIRAGYSPRTARQAGAETLSKPDIADAIQKAQSSRAQRIELTQDQVVRELMRIAFLDPRRVLQWGPDGVKVRPSAELSADEAAAVAEASQTITKDGGSIRVKLADKIAALTLLGKHLGMFLDKLEVKAASRLVIEEEVVDGDPDPNHPPAPQTA